jgi:RNA polymerase-interacting CarD/CdnL/TRCF family regulator
MEDQAEICAELKRLEQQLALLAAEGEHRMYRHACLFMIHTIATCSPPCLDVKS